MDAIDYLLLKGADINSQEHPLKHSPLTVAVESSTDRHELVLKLLEKGFHLLIKSVTC